MYNYKTLIFKVSELNAEFFNTTTGGV